MRRCTKPEPLSNVRWELGEQSPCRNCGCSLLAALRPGTNLVTWDGGREGVYWRHKRWMARSLALCIVQFRSDGTQEWVEAAEQTGPKADVYLISMWEAAKADLRDVGELQAEPPAQCLHWDHCDCESCVAECAAVAKTVAVPHDTGHTARTP